MKFLVDAQLPRRLCQELRECGHDAAHTLDLSSGNRTSDAEIMVTVHSPLPLELPETSPLKSSEVFHQHRTEIRSIVTSNRVTNPRVFGSVLHARDQEGSDLDIVVDPTPVPFGPVPTTMSVKLKT
jgi:hypothetical protein